MATEKKFADVIKGRTWSDLTEEEADLFVQEHSTPLGADDGSAPVDLPDYVPLPEGPDDVQATFVRKRN